MSNENGTERNADEIVTDRFAEVFRRTVAIASHMQQCISRCAAGDDQDANLQRAHHAAALALADFDVLDSIATTSEERHWLATDGAAIRAGARAAHDGLRP